MKHHIMIALGLLMGAIFGFRLGNALPVSGTRVSELCFLGGVVISALLIFLRLQEFRHTNEARRD